MIITSTFSGRAFGAGKFSMLASTNSSCGRYIGTKPFLSHKDLNKKKEMVAFVTSHMTRQFLLDGLANVHWCGII